MNALKIKVGLTLSLFLLSSLSAQVQPKKELIELFDLNQYLPSIRYDSETKKDKELVETSLWIDQSDDKRTLSSLLISTPAKGLTAFEWINSSQNVEIDHIGISKKTGVVVYRNNLKGSELHNFQMLFVAKKGYSSKLFFSDFNNAEGLSLKLYVRVEQTGEPVNLPLQITAYNVDEWGKVKFYTQATQACSFDGVFLDETNKSLEFHFKKSNSDGKCTEGNKLESSL